jgi:predicted MFS family arabinose efflux permease
VGGWGRTSGHLQAGAAVAFGGSLALAAVAPTLHYEMVAMLPVGVASTAFIAMSNSLLQLGAAPQMRGRVMGLFAVVFLGTTPIGGPLMGWIAEHLGPRGAMAIAAGVTVAAGLATLLTLQRTRSQSAAEEPVILESARQGVAAP